MIAPSKQSRRQDDCAFKSTTSSAWSSSLRWMCCSKKITPYQDGYAQDERTIKTTMPSRKTHRQVERASKFRASSRWSSLQGDSKSLLATTLLVSPFTVPAYDTRRICLLHRRRSLFFLTPRIPVIASSIVCGLIRRPQRHHRPRSLLPALCRCCRYCTATFCQVSCNSFSQKAHRWGRNATKLIKIFNASPDELMPCSCFPSSKSLCYRLSV